MEDSGYEIIIMALLLTSIFTQGLSLGSVATWIIAPLIVWLGTVTASIVLPLVLFKKALGQNSER